VLYLSARQVGRYPVTARSARRRKARWLAGISTLAIGGLALWIVLKPAPWREFVPWCGSIRDPDRIERPIRERFLLLMAEVFTDLGMENAIKDGRLFTRGDESFDGELHWMIADIETNFQHRVVQSFGVDIDDVFFPPPPALIAEIRATEKFYGPFPRRNEEGERIYGSDPRFESCTLMRAAILKDP
jgi:hypothetical protein